MAPRRKAKKKEIRDGIGHGDFMRKMKFTVRYPDREDAVEEGFLVGQIALDDRREPNGQILVVQNRAQFPRWYYEKVITIKTIQRTDRVVTVEIGPHMRYLTIEDGDYEFI